MRRQLKTLAWGPLGLVLATLIPGAALGAGFGTPTMDGLLTGDESIYNAAEASDPVDPPQGFANLDLGTLHVANDNDFWYFLFTVNDDIGATNWGKYLMYIDTTNDAAGGTTDAWGRNVVVNDPHKPEYSVRGWVDGGGVYGPSKTQLWSWDGAAWNEVGTADGAALSTGTTSGIEWKVSRTALGNPSTIWVEVATTGGTDTDNVQDTANDPADDWNAVDWTSPADIDNTTEVAVQTGVDTTPPTLVSGCVDPDFDTDILLTFSEPLDTPTAGTSGNYAVTGGKTVLFASLENPTTVRLILDSAYGFGACQQVEVTGVKDVAGNTIVDNNTTNVVNFYRYQVLMQGRMSIHMQADDTPPHTFAIEGSVSPLTWEPLCDFPLADSDGDSTYTAFLNFCLPCTTASSGAKVQEVEYKFTHQCTEYEELAGNHFYNIDVTAQPDGVDTLDIWWADEAPVDFTSVDIDVIYRVQSAATAPPFLPTDSLATNGSETPLSWDVPVLPANVMKDDGVAPDDTALDGIYSHRVTFPSGTLKNVQFKFMLKSLADTTWNFECADPMLPSLDNRDVFLNDSLFSTSNPIVLDVAYYDDCSYATDVSEFAAVLDGLRLEPSRPNPARESTVIAYTIASETHVSLDVFDVQGRLVRSLVNEIRPEGRHAVVWNGRKANGAPLPGGVYFTRFVAEGRSESRKIVLMR